MVPNPYAADLGDRDPLAAMSDTPRRIHAIVSRLPAAALARGTAPGKWTAQQILVHLAQTELALPVRVRMALSQDGYVVQPFDQDRWMANESAVDPTAALGAYVAVRQMNLQFFSTLSQADRAVSFRHPEYGVITVEWVIRQMAGHELHHLRQLETIVGEA